LVVFIVYILSRIVNKFFLHRVILTVDKHLHLALFRPDYHRLIAHAPDHVKRVHRPAAKGQFQSVFLHAFFKRLFQLVGDFEKPIGRAQSADTLVRALVVVILDPERGSFHGLLKTVELGALKKLAQDRLPKPLDLTQGHRMVRA
jgi:hypothetical protein